MRVLGNGGLESFWIWDLCPQIQNSCSAFLSNIDQYSGIFSYWHTRPTTFEPTQQFGSGIEIIIALQEYQMELPITFSVSIILLNAKYQMTTRLSMPFDGSKRLKFWISSWIFGYRSNFGLACQIWPVLKYGEWWYLVSMRGAELWTVGCTNKSPWAQLFMALSVKWGVQWTKIPFPKNQRRWKDWRTLWCFPSAPSGPDEER